MKKPKNNRIKLYIKENWCIIAVLVVSLFLHVLTTIDLGIDYTINSDDASYIASGITFAQTGKITMHGVISAQIMPGMTFLIGFISLVFGTGNVFMYILKILWSLMGISTIYVVYKTIRLYSNNKFISTIPCLFFLAIDYVLRVDG